MRIALKYSTAIMLCIGISSTAYAQNQSNVMSVKEITTEALGLGSEALKTLRKVSEHQISYLTDNASELIELRDNIKDAPVKGGILTKSKKDYRTDAQELLDEVFNNILEGKLAVDYESIRNAENKIERLEKKRDQLIEKRYFAPEQGGFWESSKKELTQDIEKIEKQISDQRLFISDIEADLQSSLEEIGIKLSIEQIKSLTMRADSDDLFKVFILFDITKSMTNTLGDLLAEVKSNKSDSQVKYYGSYVLLAELLVTAQQTYIDKVNNKYLPTLKEIEKQTKENIKFAKDKIKLEDNSTNIQILRNNIKANDLSLQVIELYKNMLIEQRNRTQSALKVSKKQVDVAYSSYDTAIVTKNVMGLISEDQLAFDELMSLQLPVIIPMDNSELSSKFSELSKKLR